MTTNPFNGGYINQIIYGSSTFCAISPNNGIQIATSPDGSNWTVSPFSFGNSSGNLRITYGPTGFVAAFSAGGSSSLILTSIDGNIWIVSYTGTYSIAYPNSTVEKIYDVVFGNSVWCAVGQVVTTTGGSSPFDINVSNTTLILISTDGNTWNPISNTLNGIELTRIAYGTLGFCAISTTNIICTSPDGFTWSSLPSTLTSSLQDIVFGSIKINGTLTPVWLVNGYNNSGTSVIATSPDGSVWTRLQSIPFNIVSAITWNGTYWCVSGLNTDTSYVYSNSIARSPDGIIWTISSNFPFINGMTSGIAYGSSRWCIVGTGINSVNIATSPDTDIWTLISSGTVIFDLNYPTLPGFSYATSIQAATSINMAITIGFPILIPGQSVTPCFVVKPLTANSSSQTLTYSIIAYSPGPTLTFNHNGKYYLYLLTSAIVYFSNKEDADANTNFIGASLSYTLGHTDRGSIGGTNLWSIASNPGGNYTQSLQNYTNGFQFTQAGIINVYPAPLPITYFSNKANALANTNSIGSSTSYIIGSVTTGTTGRSTIWSIASNVGGSYPASSQVYPNGFELASVGSFNLYPSAPPPSTFSNIPVALAYATYSLPSIKAQVIALNLLIANIKLISGISLTAKILTAQTKKKLAGYTSICIGDAIYNNNKTSYNLTMLNQSMTVLSQYLLPAKTATTEKAIQTIFAKFLLAINSNKVGLDNALALFTAANACYTKADALSKATGAKVAAAKTAFTASVKALNKSAATMLVTVKKIQTTLVSNNSAMIAIFNL